MKKIRQSLVFLICTVAMTHGDLNWMGDSQIFISGNSYNGSATDPGDYFDGFNLGNFTEGSVVSIDGLVLISPVGEADQVSMVWEITGSGNTVIDGVYLWSMGSTFPGGNDEAWGQSFGGDMLNDLTPGDYSISVTFWADDDSTPDVPDMMDYAGLAYFQVIAVPEPGTFWLMSIALIGAMVTRKGREVFPISHVAKSLPEPGKKTFSHKMGRIRISTTTLLTKQ